MQIYSPFWQTPTGSAAIVVRGTLPAERSASTLRGLVRSMDAALAVADLRTMEQLVSEASAERRFQTLVLTAFGGISLFLSLLGLYALMAYSVQRRTAEIGVRMALGAQRSAVMGLVLRQGANPVARRNCTGSCVRVECDPVDAQPAFRSASDRPARVCGSGSTVFGGCGRRVLCAGAARDAG